VPFPICAAPTGLVPCWFADPRLAPWAAFFRRFAAARALGWAKGFAKRITFAAVMVG